MLEQAKNAKERMQAAGFQYPKEFTVRTERIVKPLMGFVGYGDAIITINPMADEKAVDHIEAMREQGLSITHYTGTIRQWVRAEDDQQGRYVVVDFSRGTTTEIIHEHDARLISLPKGVQVMRDNKIRYHWYNQITDTSRRRLWGLMDNCLQLASNPDTYIWKDQRRTSTMTESITSQPPQQRWRVESLQFGYYDIKYAPTRREAREIRRAALLRPQTEKSHVVDTHKQQGSSR